MTPIKGHDFGRSIIHQFLCYPGVNPYQEIHLVQSQILPVDRLSSFKM